MIWRFLTAVSCLVVAGAFGLADNCATVPVAPAYEAVSAVQVVLVPAYFAAYSPVPIPDPADPPKTGPVAMPAPVPTDDLNRAILEELRKQNQKLDQLLQLIQGGPAAPAAKPADTALATVTRVLSNSCVKCHGSTVADAKGGGFTMVGADGLTPKFSPQELSRIRSRVGKGEMPPKSQPPLTVEEKAAMTTFFK